MFLILGLWGFTYLLRRKQGYKSLAFWRVLILAFALTQGLFCFGAMFLAPSFHEWFPIGARTLGGLAVGWFLTKEARKQPEPEVLIETISEEQANREIAEIERKHPGRLKYHYRDRHKGSEEG